MTDPAASQSTSLVSTDTPWLSVGGGVTLRRASPPTGGDRRAWRRQAARRNSRRWNHKPLLAEGKFEMRKADRWVMVLPGSR